MNISSLSFEFVICLTNELFSAWSLHVPIISPWSIREHYIFFSWNVWTFDISCIQIKIEHVMWQLEKSRHQPKHWFLRMDCYISTERNVACLCNTRLLFRSKSIVSQLPSQRGNIADYISLPFFFLFFSSILYYGCLCTLSITPFSYYTPFSR